MIITIKYRVLIFLANLADTLSYQFGLALDWLQDAAYEVDPEGHKK